MNRRLDKHAVMLVDHNERLKRIETDLKRIETDHGERLKRIETKLEGIVYPVRNLWY